MSCDPVRPCGAEAPNLAVVPPRPGLRYLARRLGRYQAFLDDLVAAVEGIAVSGGGPGDRLLGDRWDLLADPPALLLAELWALVADSVATYTELTASETYLGTASDWTDLRRLADLVGYTPRPGVAARGWVEVDIERGSSPLVLAGTRVQAPAAAPDRPKAQLFEVDADTQLRADWGGLTATWVPQPAVPTGRSVRFLGDPGFSVGDRVLIVLEQPGVSLSAGYSWFQYWTWLLQLILLLATPSSTPLAVARVLKRRSELGTTVVEFDRDLDRILPDVDKPYAAYRITNTAGSARHLMKVLNVAGGSATPVDVSGSTFYATPGAITATSVVLDVALDDLSADQLVAVVDWDNAAGPKSDIVRVAKHAIVRWEAAPGSPTRVSKLSFAASVPTLVLPSGEVTIHVLDRRQVARHYEFPASQPPGSPAQLRLFPAPAVVPTLVALDVGTVPGTPDWRLLDVRAASQQEQPGADVPAGLTVDIASTSDPPPVAGRAPASANLVPVRHGATSSATLGSGDALQTGQRLPVSGAPVAYDADATGNIVPTLVARVDGVAWAEVPTLYGTGPTPVFATQLGPDGSVVLLFGDGEEGRRLPTGRNNVTARYRVGGGTAGEVPSGAITSLVGSVRGVTKVRGAGPTTGGADQDAERDLRRLVPTRARAFGRVVSEGDLADVALAYPGVSHAVAWRGPGPPGCPCGGVGLHLAVLRRGSGAGAPPRPALGPEITALAAYLDSRRDVLVPLCVCAGLVTPLSVAATLVVDPRRVAGEVATAAAAGLADPDGPLSPGERRQGQAVDRSDLLAVLHAAAGVVGVVDLTVTGGTLGPTAAETELGRQPASRWELLVLAPLPALATMSP